MDLKVVFVGGRQAQRLCAIYGRLSGAPGDAAWIDVIAKLHPSQEELVASADLLALQACGAPLPVDFDEIAVKPDRVWFPELALDFLWPFSGQPHLANASDALFPEGPFPVELGDAWLNRRLEGRQIAAVIEAEYLALDVAAMLDLDSYMALALERQAELDRACGDDFAARLEDQFRARAIFVNPLTPSPELLRELAQRLFTKMRASFTLPDDLRPYLSRAPELPVHPSVAAHFNLTWASGRRYRIWTDERIDFPEFVRRYLAYTEGPELEAGVRLVAERRAEEGVAHFEIAAARPMGRRTLAHQRAFALTYGSSPHAGAGGLLRFFGDWEGNTAVLAELSNFYDHGRWKDAEASALTYLETTPSSPEMWRLLADIREKLGDGEGRVAALQAASALRPDDTALQNLLMTSHAAKGDLAAAIAAAEAEIALNPYDPRVRAFLSHLLERVGEPARAKAELTRALEIVAIGEEYADLRNALNRHRINFNRVAPPTA